MSLAKQQLKFKNKHNLTWYQRTSYRWLIDWFANMMRSIESMLCSTQCDRVEVNVFFFFLIADSYKYTWISNKVYKDLSSALLPSVSVSNQGYSGLSHGKYTWILSATELTKTCKLHCISAYQPVTQGIAACHLKCIPEYQSETKYTKTHQLHCTPKYQSVT